MQEVVPIILTTITNYITIVLIVVVVLTICYIFLRIIRYDRKKDSRAKSELSFRNEIRQELYTCKVEISKLEHEKKKLNNEVVNLRVEVMRHKVMLSRCRRMFPKAFDESFPGIQLNIDTQDT